MLKFKKEFFDEIEDIFSKYDILDNETCILKYKYRGISILENDILINVEWRIDRWLFSFILGFGEKVEVIEPIAIRETIKNEIEKMTLVYKKG